MTDKDRIIKNIANTHYYIGKLNIVETLGLAGMREISILALLSDCDGGSMNVSAIADKLCMSLPNVSRCLRYMEKNGEIEKCDDEGDRRNTLIKITDKGLFKLKDNAAKLDKFYFSALSRLPDNDIVAYEMLTKKIYKVYSEELAEYKRRLNKSDR